MELNRHKRANKRSTTKIRHRLGKLLGAPPASVEKQQLEHHIDSLWCSLEETQNIMDELSACYLELKHFVSQKATRKVSDEVECQEAIEKAQAVLIVICSASNTTVVTPKTSTEVSIDTSNKASAGNSEEPEHTPTTVTDLANQLVPDIGNTNPPNQIPSFPLDSSTTSGTTLPTSLVTTINLPGVSPGPAINSRLKQLKIPTFDGDKTKFEEYWALFQSLVDMSMEPIS